MNSYNFKISRVKTKAEMKICAEIMSKQDPWKRLGLSYSACFKNISAPGRFVYCAKADDEIAGLIVWQMAGVLRGYIQTVCIKPSFQGRQIGSRLIVFAEKIILKKSPNVFLCVSSFNKNACRLYKKLGYKKIGLLKDFIVSGYDEIIMRKTSGSWAKFLE